MNASPHGARVVPDGRHGDEHRLARQRHAGTASPRRWRPIGMGEEARDDVGDEDRAERQQDVLDAVEGPAQDEQRDAERGQRDADVATRPRRAAPCRPPRRRTRRTSCRVGHHQRAEHDAAPRGAVVLADQREQPLPVTTPIRAPSSWKTMSAAVESGQHPEQLVAVLGAQDRVGGDAGRVVVGSFQPGRGKWQV